MKSVALSPLTLSVLRLLVVACMLPVESLLAQNSSDPNEIIDPKFFEGLDYRMVGPYRGGRVTTVTGVPSGDVHSCTPPSQVGLVGGIVHDCGRC